MYSQITLFNSNDGRTQQPKPRLQSSDESHHTHALKINRRNCSDAGYPTPTFRRHFAVNESGITFGSAWRSARFITRFNNRRQQ
jgi:hypothetical protein